MAREAAYGELAGPVRMTRAADSVSGKPGCCGQAQIAMTMPFPAIPGKRHGWSWPSTALISQTRVYLPCTYSGPGVYPRAGPDGPDVEHRKVEKRSAVHYVSLVLLS